jgi:hypothetical protein
MPKPKFMYNCGLCGTEFQFGPGVYAGKLISCYQLTVCLGCWDGNWDGAGPSAEGRLLAHLKQKGIPIPPRNEQGWLPREFATA